MIETIPHANPPSSLFRESAFEPRYRPGSYWPNDRPLRYIDLFCGIGGFHRAADHFGMECVFACDIDDECRKAYLANYNLLPHDDICTVDAAKLPDMDVLLAGFPCQPFSIIGNMDGFTDARGTLFFDIARILDAKRPRAFVLENVRQLVSHNQGKTLARILEVLRDLGYNVIPPKVLNALNFGLPQKRERVLIVGFRDPVEGFEWPAAKTEMRPLSNILEPDPDPRHFVSDRIREARKKAHSTSVSPAIWHENKAGNISSHPFSCALRAGASYNYLLVDGERRLTPREMLRLQGFPEEFQIVCGDGQTRKQAGNSVPVPMIRAVLKGVLDARRAEA